MDKNQQQQEQQQATSKKIPNEKSMATSGSSEIFDSWTLVTEKNLLKAEKMPKKDEESDDTANRVEILNQNDKLDNCNDDDKSKSSSVEASEDLSDGISIISDSDSVGHLSPRRVMHKHPNSLDENYDPNYDEKDEEDLVPESSSAHTNCCERSSQTSKLNSQQQLLKNRKRRSSTASRSSLELDHSAIVGESAFLCPTIRHGLTSFFYVAVLLAILAFVGKLRYPEWQPLVKSSQLTEMEARIIDLELQNNLLRAEFDILSKQVTFISDRRSNNQRAKGKGDGVPPPQSHKTPNYPYDGVGGNGNNGRFEREFIAWPDDVEMKRKASFDCNGNQVETDETGKCSSQSDATSKSFINRPHADVPEAIKTGDGGDKFHQANPSKAFPSPDNFDGRQFPQQRNFKPDFKSGPKNGKHPSKKHSGERYDSRENFKRHEKPMKQHQKPPENHQHNRHPYRKSSEEFNDSRERNGGGNGYQKRNSNFDKDDKNRYREKPPHMNDDNNWYITRGNGREKARSVEDIRSR